MISQGEEKKKALIRLLKSGQLSFILKYEKKYRNKIPTLFIEIRANAVSIYYLGQRVLEVVCKKNDNYSFKTNSKFIEGIDCLKEYWWRIEKNKDVKIGSKDVENIKNNFERMLKNIIDFKSGKISEGVIQDLYYRQNRAFASDCIVLDAYSTVLSEGKGRIVDMIAAYKFHGGFQLAVIELKTDNDKRIGTVIKDQLIPYINAIYEGKEKYISKYESTYHTKKNLGLIERKDLKIQIPNVKKDIVGILILDGYNIRSDTKKGRKGYLEQLQENISDIDFDAYDINIYLKTYVLDKSPRLSRIKVTNENKSRIVAKLIGF